MHKRTFIWFTGLRVKADCKGTSHWISCKLGRCSNQTKVQNCVFPFRDNSTRLPSCWIDSQDCESKLIIFDFLHATMLLKSCWTMSKQGAILYVPPYRANLTGLPSRRIDSQDCESKPIARELHLWFRSKSTGLPAWNKSVKSLDCNFTAKSSVHSCHLLTSIPILWTQVQESRIKEIRLTTIRAQQSQAMEGVNAIFGLQDQNEALQSGPHKLVVPQKIGGEGRRWVFQKRHN
jgi:hypothetical protein